MQCTEVCGEKKQRVPIQMSIKESNLPYMNTQMPFRVMTHLFPPYLASVPKSQTQRWRMPNPTVGPNRIKLIRTVEAL